MIKKIIGYSLVSTPVLMLLSYLLDSVFKRSFNLGQVFLAALAFSIIYNCAFEWRVKKMEQRSK
ncbi:hypothetical protein [Lactobacillus sp.]|uniref:hypothetical protein n=1 Tax=Lactobacillus sp. TaxID=1591 RepID=UPI003EF222D3